jgi:iron(III) transport system substrate-binding protein
MALRKSRKGPFLVFGFTCRIALLLVTDPVSAGVVKPAWQLEWKKTIESAKKEGQVNVHLKVGYDGVFPAFMRRFPEINVIGVAGQVNDIGQRLLAERRAEKYLADVVSLGIRPVYTDFYRLKILDPVRPLLILPEVVDESKWYEGHRYADPERKYIFIYLSVVQEGGIHYNTKLISSGDFRSFWDFLNPKWKGKILARDVRTPGPGGGAMRFFYYHPELGPEFVRRLFGEMDITLFRNVSQGTDWLAIGKFPICFFCDVEVAKRQGLPVDTFGTMKEGAGIVSQSGQIALIKNAPHPNAAKVFINWLLSREGQIEVQRVLARVQPAESRRIDIPRDNVPVEVRRVGGVKYLDLDSRPQWMEMRPIYKAVNEALNHAGKK